MDQFAIVIISISSPTEHLKSATDPHEAHNFYEFYYPFSLLTLHRNPQICAWILSSRFWNPLRPAFLLGIYILLDSSHWNTLKSMVCCPTPYCIVPVPYLYTVSYHIDTKYTVSYHTKLHTDIVKRWYWYGDRHWDGEPCLRGYRFAKFSLFWGW